MAELIRALGNDFSLKDIEAVLENVSSATEFQRNMSKYIPFNDGVRIKSILSKLVDDICDPSKPELLDLHHQHQSKV